MNSVYLKSLLSLFFISISVTLSAQIYMPNYATRINIQSAKFSPESNQGFVQINGDQLVLSNFKDKNPTQIIKTGYSGYDRNKKGYLYYIHLAPDAQSRFPKFTRQIKTDSNSSNIRVIAETENKDDFMFKEISLKKIRIISRDGRVLTVDSNNNIVLKDPNDPNIIDWNIYDSKNKEPFTTSVAPLGTVSDSITGEPIAGVEVSIHSTFIYKFKYTKTTTDTNGRFEFEPLLDHQVGYRVILSKEGYGSKVIEGHGSIKWNDSVFKLLKSTGYYKFAAPNKGDWLYSKTADGQYNYIYGQVKQDNALLFTGYKSSDPVVEWFRGEIGLSATKATTDEEIYAEFRKVWNFWSDHWIGMMGNRPTLEQRKLVNDHFKETNPKPWPTVVDIASFYKDHGFIPVYNCSSKAITISNILTLTGIPHSKMAIEVMHPNNSASGEHWAVILKLNNSWYWFDPAYTNSKLLPGMVNIKTAPQIGYSRDYAYNSPFKIYLFPESEQLNVPFCGYKFDQLIKQ